MQEFEVNVHATVHARQSSPSHPSAGEIEGWEVYDGETTQDGTCIFRCDQPVSVKANSEAQAIEQAKADATKIRLSGFKVESVRLWVDEDMGVTLKEYGVQQKFG